MPTGLHPVWPQHLISMSSPAKGLADHSEALGSSTTETRVPRQGSPLHGAQQGRSGFIVEGDDDAGGRQVRGVGQGWTTEEGAERSEGSCGSVLRAGFEASLCPACCPPGIPLWDREIKPEARMWALPLHTHVPPTEATQPGVLGRTPQVGHLPRARSSSPRT